MLENEKGDTDTLIELPEIKEVFTELFCGDFTESQDVFEEEDDLEDK